MKRGETYGWQSKFMQYHIFDKNYHLDHVGSRNVLCGCSAFINLRSSNHKFWPYVKRGNKKRLLDPFWKRIKFEENLALYYNKR